MRKWQTAFVMLITSICFVSCDIDPLEVTPVQLEVSGENILVTNNTSTNIYYFVLSEESSFAIDWVASVDEFTPFVPPSSVKEIAIDDILFYDQSDRRVQFNYWIGIRRRGEIVPGNVSVITVDLNSF